MLRIGVLGSGSAASRHVEAVKESGVGVITQVYSPAVDASDFAARHGALVSGSPDDVFKDEAINCIVIASPTDTHAEYLKQAHAAGKHLVCEAPLVRTEAEANDVESLFRDTKHLVSCGFIRHQGEYRHLRNTVASDALGQIGMVRLSRCIPYPLSSGDWRGDIKRSGGVILDLLVHDLDALEWCFGRVARIQAMRPAAGRENLRLDYAILTAKMESGAVAHIEGSWVEAANGGYCAYEIAGAQGILDYDSRNEPVIAAVSKTDETGVQTNQPNRDADCTLWKSFAAAISGDGKLENPWSVGLRSTRLALAALESAVSNSPVVI